MILNEREDYLMTDNNTIASKIKRYRKERNMTQDELSERCGISVSTIKKYETGNRNPKLDQLNKIATALNINVSAFIDTDINTIGDVLSMLFKIERNTDINWNYQRDENNQILPDTISISFTNSDINNLLAKYLLNKDTSPLPMNNDDYEEDFLLNDADSNILIEYHKKQ